MSTKFLTNVPPTLGGQCNWCPPQLKHWGGRVPPVPNRLTPLTVQVCTLYRYVMYVTVCCVFRCDLFDVNLQQTVELAEKYALTAV